MKVATPPDIAHFRSHGITRLDVYCQTLGCHHFSTIDFDRLGLPDHIPLIEIPRHRRFRCERCGGTSIEVRPDWTQHKTPGNGSSRHQPKGQVT